MAYQCPRCGGKVQRGSNTGASLAGGVVGAMIYAAFGDFNCKECGVVPKSEFPDDVRRKMMVGSIVMVGVALAVLAGVIGLIVYMKPMH